MHPRNVLIVGGGVVGWMTAAHLDAVLNRGGRRRAAISLLETAGTASSGTGESTLASFNHVLDVLGVDHAEVMRRADGTFKHATKFVNWLHQGHAFYEPFALERAGTVDRAGPNWLRSNRSIAFAETVSVQPALCEMNLVPHMPGLRDSGPPLPFGYHLDEVKFADYLSQLTMARGVSRHAEDLADVERTEAGNIAAVITAGGRRLEADLFIDCSGVAALLIGERAGVEWERCDQWLLCDRMLTMQVPYDLHYPGTVHPYTTSTALSAGWVREIPLRDRRSLSYTYSSDFSSREQAEAELRAYEGAHADSLEVQAAGFTAGRRRNAWAGNCIAIGPAQSVIEPLGSTDLYLANLAAAMLAEHFPYDDELTPLAFRFNRIMANRFHEIVDFLNLHYFLSRRDDSAFWLEVQKPARASERLQAKLEFWRQKPPSRSDFEDQYFPGQPRTPMPAGTVPGDYRSPVDTAGLWGYQDYESVLYGMNFLNEEAAQRSGDDRPDPEVPAYIADRLRLAVQKLPPHDLWLKRALGMPDYPAAQRGPR